MVRSWMARVSCSISVAIDIGLIDLGFSRLDGLPLMVGDDLSLLVRPVLADQDEGRQEDRLERHDHREETERILLERIAIHRPYQTMLR